MIKKIIEHIKGSKEREEKKEYEKGYSYAAAELLSKRKNVEDLQTIVDCSEHFMDYRQFDYGISQAIRDYNKLLCETSSCPYFGGNYYG